MELFGCARGAGRTPRAQRQASDDRHKPWRLTFFLSALRRYTLGGMYLARYDDSPVGAFDEVRWSRSVFSRPWGRCFLNVATINALGPLRSPQMVALGGLVWNPPTSCAWCGRGNRSVGAASPRFPVTCAAFYSSSPSAIKGRRGCTSTTQRLADTAYRCEPTALSPRCSVQLETPRCDGPRRSSEKSLHPLSAAGGGTSFARGLLLRSRRQAREGARPEAAVPVVVAAQEGTDGGKVRRLCRITGTSRAPAPCAKPLCRDVPQRAKALHSATCRVCIFQDAARRGPIGNCPLRLVQRGLPHRDAAAAAVLWVRGPEDQPQAP